jgi:hypothetical protein
MVRQPLTPLSKEVVRLLLNLLGREVQFRFINNTYRQLITQKIYTIDFIYILHNLRVQLKEFLLLFRTLLDIIVIQ